MVLAKQKLTSNQKKLLIVVIKFWSNFEFGSGLEFSGTALVTGALPSPSPLCLPDVQPTWKSQGSPAIQAQAAVSLLSLDPGSRLAPLRAH